MNNIFKSCLNYKVLIGIALAILFAYLFIPQVASFSWILIALVCPLSMMLMMASMQKNHDKVEKLFVCPECKLSYHDVALAQQCAAWCKEHKSCNLEITKHAIK